MAAVEPSEPERSELAEKDEAIRTHVIVLGAGIAGLASADILLRAGCDVTVVDRDALCGGAHRSHEIGPYTFDVGSIFYEDGAQIFNLAPGLRDQCPSIKRIQRRIDPSGKLLKYPIEPRDLLRWPKSIVARAFAQMMLSRLRGKRDGSLETACKTRLGETIATRTGLMDYITRFHHVPPAEIDESFFFHRMAFIERATRLNVMAQSGWRALRRKPFNLGAAKSLRIRPAAGFQALFGAIRQDLEARGATFAMQESLQRIVPHGQGFEVVTSAHVHHADAVVCTIPLDTAHRALFGQPSGLKSLDILTLFVSAATVDENAGNVLFNFHPEGRWKRATLYSRLYPGLGAGREFFSAEVTLPPGYAPDPDAAFQDIVRHLTGLGMATDLRLEGHAIVDAGYPLYTVGAPDVAEAVQNRVTATGVILAGRQGKFDYLPTSTGVIRQVAATLNAVELTSPDRFGKVTASAA